MSLNKGTRTRLDWLKSEMKEIHTDEEATEKWAKRALRRENTVIWAWYRDPETDLTQLEARDRAQGQYGFGTPRDYGQFNISQSSLSRLIKRVDDEILTEPINTSPFSRKQTAVDYESDKDTDGGVLDTLGHEFYAKNAPEVMDAMRETIARTIVDWITIQAFTSADHRTPDWAQDRFDMDPNLGLQLREQRKRPDPHVDPHEPHDTS